MHKVYLLLLPDVALGFFGAVVAPFACQDLKKSKGSGKTGSLGDRTMRELSLEDYQPMVV